MPSTHLAIYPGSFDPLTFGHLDVIARGRRLFDRLLVAVGHNPSKSQLFTLDERVDMARTLTADLAAADPEGAPIEVGSYTGLTVDFARRAGATAILRGIRNLPDLQYEVQQAVTNREVAGLETVFVVAGQSFAYTSSSLIRQIAAMGEDLSVLGAMVPAPVITLLREKRQQGHPLLEQLRASTEGDAADG